MLSSLADVVKGHGFTTQVYNLTGALPMAYMDGNDASIMLVKNGAELFLNEDEGEVTSAADSLFNEQQELDYDTKFYNTRQRKTLNKRARYNTTFGECDIKHNDDYSIPTCHAFPPLLSKFRSGLSKLLGPKADDLKAEGNFYFEPKSGIGYHGDEERKVVICLSLGSTSTIRFNWRLPGTSEHTLPPTSITCEHGDVYIMSEKATGWDWKMRSKVRVVHGAGSAKYIDSKKKKETGVKRKREARK